MSRRIGVLSQTVAAAVAGALVMFLWRGPARAAAPGSAPLPSSTKAAADSRSQFMLLLIDPGPPPSAARAATPIDEIVADHRAWAQRLRAEGRLVAAEKLTDDPGRELSPAGAAPSSSAAVPGTRVGGFYIIRARDYEEASRIARDGPALKYGERVQVRMIEGT
jgi:hypothetical protein